MSRRRSAGSSAPRPHRATRRNRSPSRNRAQRRHAMKYVEQVLQPGEKVIYATSLHWLVYLRAILLVILAGGCLVASGMFPEPGVKLALTIVAALLGLLALVSGLSALVRRSTTELAVTDRRVIFTT